MAQREKETEIQITETLILCANNCGFYGNPATKNLCVSCFQAQIRVPRSGSVKIRVHDPISRSGVDPDEAIAAEALTSLPRAVTSNRCSTCRKKVGLTGFRCRCGDLFCGAHRYSDRHECSYDYKEAGREEIRRGNPMVRAAKIVRI